MIPEGNFRDFYWQEFALYRPHSISTENIHQFIFHPINKIFFPGVQIKSRYEICWLQGLNPVLGYCFNPLNNLTFVA